VVFGARGTRGGNSLAAGGESVVGCGEALVPDGLTMETPPDPGPEAGGAARSHQTDNQKIVAVARLGGTGESVRLCRRGGGEVFGVPIPGSAPGSIAFPLTAKSLWYENAL
jgi:hypothetical protein